MKKIFILCCVAGLLGACSNFLKEYSQDLAKVESLTDLDEVLLGDGYMPVAKFDNSYSYWVGTNVFFQSIHYMGDELALNKQTNMGDDFKVQESMFGWWAWQQSVGLPYEGNTRTAENTDWQKVYACINICNIVLETIDGYPANNRQEELQKKRIKGEAHFLRALYYFTLANLYGQPYCAKNLATPAVPLKLSEYVEDKEYTTNTVEEVYAQVFADLEEADAYLVGNEVKNHPYRADITAVYLLKSRVYLYTQQWEKALEYAKKVLADERRVLMDLNGYTDAPDKELFTKQSPEIIFSMGGYPLANYIYNSRSSDGKYPVYTISDDLAEAFEEGDNDWRTSYYIMKESIGGVLSDNSYIDAWVFNKVKGWNMESKEAADHFMFRVSEAYLNAAEAAAYLGDEATARTMLKTLRDNRLQNSGTLTQSGEELVKLIRRERQCELCLEGHRWFDLRRYMVCEKFPYSKEITHLFHTKFVDKTISLGWFLINIRIPVEAKSYTLKENDPAYTLTFPKEVLDFQNTLECNQRPFRPGELVASGN